MEKEFITEQYYAPCYLLVSAMLQYQLALTQATFIRGW